MEDIVYLARLTKFSVHSLLSAAAAAAQPFFLFLLWETSSRRHLPHQQYIQFQLSPLATLMLHTPSHEFNHFNKKKIKIKLPKSKMI